MLTKGCTIIAATSSPYIEDIVEQINEVLDELQICHVKLTWCSHHSLSNKSQIYLKASLLT